MIDDNIDARTTTGALTAITLFVSSLIVTWYFWKQRLYNYDPITGKKLPPEAAPACNTSSNGGKCRPFGFFEFLSGISGPNGPDFTLEICRRFGYVFRVPGTRRMLLKDVFLVADPKIARSMLENRKNNFKAWRPYSLFEYTTGGENFFSANGHRTNHVRKATSMAFSSHNVSDMAKTIDNIVDEWIDQRLQPLYLETGNPIDIDQEMIFLTADVISQVGFEYVMGTEEKTTFVNHLRDVIHINLSRRSHPLKRGRWFAYLFPDVRRARRATKELQQKAKVFLMKSRQRQQEQQQQKATGGGEGDGVINTNSLIYIISNDPDYESDDQRARDILMFFFAGFDTTAHSIAWTMLEMAKNPQEQIKVRQSLKEWANSSSKKENGGGGGGGSDSNGFRYCPELKHVTRESLRLHPPAPLGGYRILGEDISISKDVVIPKGSLCGVPIYSLMRNHLVFDDPNSFVPSRWKNPTEDVMKAFMPFLVGKRNCLGQALANVELTGVVGRLCRDFEFEIANEGSPHFAVTYHPMGSLLKVRRLVENL